MKENKDSWLKFKLSKTQKTHFIVSWWVWGHQTIVSTLLNLLTESSKRWSFWKIDLSTKWERRSLKCTNRKINSKSFGKTRLFKKKGSFWSSSQISIPKESSLICRKMQLKSLISAWSKTKFDRKNMRISFFSLQKFKQRLTDSQKKGKD